MTLNEQKLAAKAFAESWKGRGDEKQETQKFWLELLHDVFGVANPTSALEFEKRVKLEGSIRFIDVYIPDTRVIVEQKSVDIDLSKEGSQSGGDNLTPYNQARRYDNNLPVLEKARWIVCCNFERFEIHDMQKPLDAPEVVLLNNLEKDFAKLKVIADVRAENIRREEEISFKAGKLVGELYDLILPQYKDPNNADTLRSLNQLCVRLVFCLYAEDTGLFGEKDKFYNYLKEYNPGQFRKALIELFKVFDTAYEDRDAYMDPALASFPYIKGGLFTEDIEIPLFTPEIIDKLLVKASLEVDWSDISPTIFGAVFESTLNPETRRSGGMHYTSVENIHKVIDPLFLDELKVELNVALDIPVKNKRDKALTEYQKKLASLKFLDPACGSGNFLTETYLSIRRMENKVLEALGVEGQLYLGDDFSPIKVKIDQFYGIEINDFAVSVARTALWIAEAQTLKETEHIVGRPIDYFPLKENPNIVEANALRIDWNEVVSASEVNYIMGNPPFVGQAMRTKEQAQEMVDLFFPSPAGGKLDYVAGWYKKAFDYTLSNKRVEIAFVSSNSICQGESVNLLWQMLLPNGLYINFAYTTFAWTSEAKDKAAVMCVIVGFSRTERRDKVIFTGRNKVIVEHINGFLSSAPDIYIQNRSKSINGSVAKVVQGSPPADDGRLILSKEEKDFLVEKYPILDDVIKPLTGSREFINDVEYSRFCFWFPGHNMATYRNIPELTERFEYIRNYRLASPVDRIRKTADKPYLFTQNRQPDTDYLIIPRVSSSNRKYIPIGFLPASVIASDSAVLVYNASLYEFGLISSGVHNAWMRTVAGRLKNDYRYAPSVFYNFPMPSPSSAQKERILTTAQGILDARTVYSDCSLADMYGSQMYLFPEVLAAHHANDKAVMDAYGFRKDMSESEIVAELFKMYQKLTEE